MHTGVPTPEGTVFCPALGQSLPSTHRGTFLISPCRRKEREREERRKEGHKRRENGEEEERKKEKKKE